MGLTLELKQICLSVYLHPPGRKHASDIIFSMINPEVKLGINVKIYHPDQVNLYGCKIGDECVIGAFVEIRKEVIIGNRVKIQAGAFIPEGVIIEDEVFIGPHVCFTNDIYPRSTDSNGTILVSNVHGAIPTRVCKRASIGANATILCGITIGENALVGAGAVVTRDVPPGAIVVGNPAKVIRKRKSGE